MKTKLMCSLVLGCAAVLAAPQVLTAQEPPPGPPPGGSPMHNPDQMFLHKAAEGGMLEVQLGQLAAQKSTNPGVQGFGQKMVQDHTMLNDQMKPIAESMSVMPPERLDRKDQATYDRLAGLSGPEFDHAYIRDMVMDHRMDLREFRHEEATTANPQLKQAVSQGIQVISQHLQMVMQLAKQNGVEVPMREGPGGPGGPGGQGGPGGPGGEMQPPPPPPAQ